MSASSAPDAADALARVHAQAQTEAAVEAMAMPARAGHREIPLSDDIVDAEPAPSAARPEATPSRQARESASLVVAHAGATWRIDATRASRLEAAQQPARLSGPPLLGAPDLIARARPLDLRWQGRDLAGAWQ